MSAAWLGHLPRALPRILKLDCETRQPRDFQAFGERCKT